MYRLALPLALVCLVACDKADPPGPSTTNTNTAPSASAVAVAPSAASGATAASSAAPTTASAGASAGSFAGSYESKASTLYLPDTKEMQKVKWRGEESTEGLGKGDLTLVIAADGTVTGESSGPLGAMLVQGHADGDTVAGSLRRKTGDDGGFTGTLHATKKNGALTGDMSLTKHDASVLRVATFTLAGK